MSDRVIRPGATMLIETLENMLNSGAAFDAEGRKKAWEIAKTHAARFDEVIADHDAKAFSEIATLKEKNTGLTNENHELMKQIGAYDRELQLKEEEIKTLTKKNEELLAKNAFLSGREDGLMTRLNCLENASPAKKAKTLPEKQGEGGRF